MGAAGIVMDNSHHSNEICITNGAKLISGVPTTFGDHFKSLIKAKFGENARTSKDYGLREFVRAADIGLEEHSATGALSRVLNGMDPPPVKYLDAWETALGLQGDERQLFEDLAMVATMHERFRGRCRDLLILSRAASLASQEDVRPFLAFAARLKQEQDTQVDELAAKVRAFDAKMDEADEIERGQDQDHRTA